MSPADASSGVPGSITSATRFFPLSAGASAQIVAKSPAARGARGFLPPTANRQPSTDPSAGTTLSGPLVENTHLPPVHW